MHESETRLNQHKNCRLKIGKGRQIVQLAMLCASVHSGLASYPGPSRKRKGLGTRLFLSPLAVSPKGFGGGKADSLHPLDKTSSII